MELPRVGQPHADREQRDRPPQRAVAAVEHHDEHERDAYCAGEHRRNVAERERQVDLGVQIVGVGQRAAEAPLACVEVGDHPGAADQRHRGDANAVRPGTPAPRRAEEARRSYEGHQSEPDEAGEAVRGEQAKQRQRESDARARPKSRGPRLGLRAVARVTPEIGE